MMDIIEDVIFLSEYRIDSYKGLYFLRANILLTYKSHIKK